MIKWIELPEENSVYKEETKVTRRGNIFTTRQWIGPYWGLQVTCEPTEVNATANIQLEIVSWKGESKQLDKPITAGLIILQDNKVIQEDSIKVQDKATYEWTPTASGTYVVVATYTGWNEGVCLLNVK